MTDSIAFRVDGLPNEEAMKQRSREIGAKIGESEELIRTAGWGTVYNSAAATLREQLAKQDGLDWLAYAWTKSHEIKTAALETLDGVPERCVALAGHSLSQEVLPTVVLSCAGLELALEFTLELSAEVECVDLVVQHGCLVAIRAGRLSPGATLSFKGIEIHRIDCDPMDFPEHRLPGDGLRIASKPPPAAS